ncbi:MAG: CoA ester lyase [Chloroflexi bacterium]|nr:CoA ester lyase [Chloroflexota bacterium]
MIVSPRCYLYVPGNRERMLARAPTVGADALVLDLEDSVPPAQKAATRELVAAAIPRLAAQGQRVYVRVNALATGLAEDDLAAVVVPGLEGIALPKVQSPAEVARVAQALDRLEGLQGIALGSLQVRALIETPEGLLNARAIAGAPRLTAISLGAEDFLSVLGVSRSRTAVELLYARSHIVVAAHAAGVDPIDSVYVDLDDDAGLLEDTRLARQLGFKARSAIHPRQVAPIQAVFTPSAEEVAWARRVLEAYREAEALGYASVAVDGKMIDIPIVERAQRLLSGAEAIAGR